MPPKKKEQQIDISTLPQCTSLNIMLLVKGRKQRSIALQQAIQNQAQKFLIRIKKNQVLDHAKQKGIYIDPSTLTDKQKKDPKFMETVKTELTAEVIAKATQSLISSHVLKARIEKKNNPTSDKQAQLKQKPYDVLFVFEDFPETKDQFQELYALKQSIKFIFVIEPKLNWSNAPEIEQNAEEEGEEDEEIKEYKALLKKEQKIEEDILFEKSIDKRINEIKSQRSKSSLQSQVRNCTISVLQPQIDPFSQEASIKEIVSGFFEHINSINSSLKDFSQWKKNVKAEKIMGQNQIPSQSIVHSYNSFKISQMLNDLALGLDSNGENVDSFNQQDQDILNLINGFTSEGKRQQHCSNISQRSSVQTGATPHFIEDNLNLQDGHLAQQIRKNIRYPGINRYLMPEIPTKSEKLRKSNLSHYSIFLKGGMDNDELMRRLQILNFQEYIKQFDEQRIYQFGNRIYQQHHDKQSLQRQLHRALEINEYNSFTKYDEDTDRLYLMLLYKNNPRRINRKLWQSNWKVVPNYQSWLKFFKNNENNLNNTQFFDIDYQKIGNIQQKSRCFTLKSGSTGAVIVNKDCTVSNTTQSFLYGIKDNITFGVRNNIFFAENRQVRVNHYYSSQDKSQTQTLILGKDFRIRIVKDGNLVIQKDGQTRTITSNGYTIIHGDKQSPAILHPNGSITYSSNTYTNEHGYGLKNSNLYTCPTLKRRTSQGQIIKRDDNTTILKQINGDKVQSKLIRFYDGTEYLVQNNVISIEKSNYPFVKCFKDNIKVVTNSFTVRIGRRSDNTYTNIIQFNDGSCIRVNKQTVNVFDGDQAQQISVNIQQNTISSDFDGQKLTVNQNGAQLQKNGKKFNARQQQQKYGDSDILPSDFIEPRLFIINNDNTGFELISQNTLANYIKQNQSQIDKVYEKKQNNLVQKHIVAKRGISHGKFIKNNFIVNLDIFNNSEEVPVSQSYKNISLRSLLKYSTLSSADVQQVQKIKKDVEQWRKNTLKEENQFGHKPRNDPTTKDKIQNKLLTIKKRQEKNNSINCDQLKEAAKNFHILTCEEIKRQLDRQNKEQQIKKHFERKRDSIVREYKAIDIDKIHRQAKQRQSQTFQAYMDHYFMTIEGKRALSQMPQWVFRPKQIKIPPELDPETKNELKNTSNINRQESQQAKERYDTVEVDIVPKGQKEIYIKPSVFTQRQIDQERSAFETQKKAYKYHEAKRKDYNLYGGQRKSKPQVPILLRTQPISQINQKYLVVEAPLDNKVKISSMKNKLTSSASSMVQMRKEGPHSLLMKTLDKGNDINKLLEKRTMMVQADLNDKLQRDILINPIEANFGFLQERKTYQLRITIKNQDVVSQRVTIKRPKSIHARAAITQMGPIAMGMTRVIVVTLKAASQILGKFSDQFQIVTKHQIYRIPIIAHVVSEGQWRPDTCSVGKGVRQIQDLQTSRKRQSTLELPKIK